MSRRLFHTPAHPDRGLYGAVAVMFCLGLVALAAGLLGVVYLPNGDFPRTSLRLGAGLIVGPGFMFAASGALVRRWWNGLQEPGRHTLD